MDTQTDKICNGLAIPAEQRGQIFDSLSGGEKTRVNLARLLLEQTDAVYSASLGTANQAQNLTQDELRQMFHIIHVDWNSGET